MLVFVLFISVLFIILVNGIIFKLFFGIRLFGGFWREDSVFILICYCRYFYFSIGYCFLYDFRSYYCRRFVLFLGIESEYSCFLFKISIINKFFLRLICGVSLVV